MTTAIVPVIFASTRSLVVALCLVVCAVWIALRRKENLPPLAGGCIGVGALLLALAAGGPIWNRADRTHLTVLVDLSPSTRGASFRDRQSLNQRIHQLVGDQPFELLGFADGNQPLPPGSNLPDIPSEQTRLSPTSADAMLLFSDGQFELPAYAPPTYPVIDPALDHPADAAVVDLRTVGPQVLAGVRGNGTPRVLCWTNATPALPATTPIGDFNQLATPIGTGNITAALPPGDRWPENDSLTLAPPPPVEQEKWWVGNNAPANWKSIMPGGLPSEAAAFLRPSLIVLNDISAEALSSDRQTRLLQYVRDLGGNVVIVGGPHAFAAGAYDNTPLDQLSPSASSPPQPALNWLLLIDGSGSMAGDPWNTELAAITALLPQLPAADNVSVGSFAESVHWWSAGKPATQTKATPPPGVAPHGPTNLAAALQQIADHSDGAAPTHLLLMSDADAELPEPAALIAALNAKKIHLHLLAIGQGAALPALRQITIATGGSLVQQLDPAQWVAGANQLLRSAMSDRYEHRTIGLIPPPPANIAEWNQTWLKADATALQHSQAIPIVARWQCGLGQVIAIAYPAEASVVETFAHSIEQPPTDPRFTVTWQCGAQLRVKVEAIDHDRYLNGEKLQLEMREARGNLASPQLMTIPQSGPGEYELAIPSPRSPQLARVKNGGRTLRQFSVAGRYAPEFEKIGNDRANLTELAAQTGGAVIEPGPGKPFDFPKRNRQISLAPELGFAGFVLMGTGLVVFRRGR